MHTGLNARPTAVVILSHLMERDGQLGTQSKARADLGYRTFDSYKLTYLITSGWAYRVDSDLSISTAVKTYLVEKYAVDPVNIIEERSARDTVGDALFVKYNIVRRLDIRTLHVVSSDYHLPRVQNIFEYFKETDCSLIFHGVPPQTHQKINSFKKEAQSLLAFQATFSKLDRKNDKYILQTLKEKHPLYNGLIHARFSAQINRPSDAQDD